MAANNLGTAYIKIAPQMQGIQKSISDGLANIKTSSLPGAAAVGTVVAKGVSAAMNLVTSSLDGAITRTDILNNFPRVMKNLGISTEDAKKAIDRLSEGLDGLPTALQDGASAVQRFTSRNNDVKKSTEIFLALNNAILAGGASTEVQTSALEQMSQAYAKGKPDMMEWRTLMMAMPAQLNQVAESMGLGKNAADKLGEGLRKGEISMDDFMNEIIKLNSKGVNGLASFEEQARGATAGIGTSLTNMRNRAQKAISTIIQAFGSKDISDAINKFSSSFAGIADWIAKNVVPVIKNTVIPIIKNLLSAIKSVVEFIRQNEWVQKVIINVFNALIAYKGLKVVTGVVSGIATSVATLGKTIGSHIGSIGSFIGKFIEAKSAGLTFGESLQWVNANTTGLGHTLTNGVGKADGFASGLLRGAAAAGAVTLAIEGVNALIKINEIQTIEATTAARNYAREHYSVSQAAESAKRAQDLLKDSINEVKDAEMAATNAEIAAIQARQDQTRYQEEMNRLRAEGKEGTDEYRLAELNYTKALEQEKVANEQLKSAQEDVAEGKAEIDNLNSSNIYKGNLVIGNILKEKGEYGNLAAQLDELKTKTLQYKDEQGNLVQASLEKSQEMVEGLAQQLSQGDATWKAIVDKAQEEGISFSEACAKYGAEGGENLIGNFKTNAEFNLPLVNATGQETVDTIRTSLENLKNVGTTSGTTFVERMAKGIVDTVGAVKNASSTVGSNVTSEMKSSTSGAYDVGKNITQGTANGIIDTQAKGSLLSRAAATIRAAVAQMKAAAQEHSPSKATAEIGKFLSLGLAKGIDDYADEAIEAAEDMTNRTISAMNADYNPGLTMNHLQPQTGLTSGMNGSGGQVIQYNDFNVESELDVKEISKRLGWQVATAL